MEKEMLQALESARNDIKNIYDTLKDLSDSMRDSNKTNLDKLDEIKLLTGDDLIMVADNIIRNTLESTQLGLKTQDELTNKLLQEIGIYLSNINKINETKESNPKESLDLIKKTRDRNILIYNILFEKNENLGDMTSLQARKKLNSIEKEIVNQLAILCIEALGMMFEGMLAMQNKEEKK